LIPLSKSSIRWFEYIRNGDKKRPCIDLTQVNVIDSTNPDIFWGYGGVYMTLGDYPRAKEQFLEGLSLSSEEQLYID
jgi:hypothetical protein